MTSVALVTDEVSLPIDYDMALLLDACQAVGLAAQVRDWLDPAVDWSVFDAVLLRSPWTYVERRREFMAWCERVDTVTDLHNPLPVVRWSLDKRYMADLAACGVPVVPSTFVSADANPLSAIEEFLAAHPQAREIVVKPTVGAYSKGVQRFARSMYAEAARHVALLHGDGRHALLQPYVESVDRDGETDLIYFDGVYSHAIRKNPMLMPDGTVQVPTLESRTIRDADEDERAVAAVALDAAAECLSLERPLLYARIDVIRGAGGAPIVLELELCEPSLNLPFTGHGATRFAAALASRLGVRVPR
jgi:O-ureido-D-serine cyclo-ligase